eukprot:7390751-Prymnesium_polylepis.2
MGGVTRGWDGGTRWRVAPTARGQRVPLHGTRCFMQAGSPPWPHAHAACGRGYGVTAVGYQTTRGTNRRAHHDVVGPQDGTRM